MDKKEMMRLLHELELDFEPQPLVNVFWRGGDGHMHNFSVSQTLGARLDNQELVSLMHKEYPATREGAVELVERPDRGLETEDDPTVEWLDRVDVMNLLHISERTLQRWTGRGLFRRSRMGRRVYYDRRDIDRALKLNLVKEDGTIDKTALLELDDFSVTSGHKRP